MLRLRSPRQRRHHLAEGGEGPVDGLCLFEANPLRPAFGNPLRPGEVEQRQGASANLRGEGGQTVLRLNMEFGVERETR